MTLNEVQRVVCVAVALAAMTSRAAGQTPPRPPLPPHVRASGEATVTAKPDRARIDIGVVTQAPTAREAAQANARQLTEVISALRKELGQGADVKTISYSVDPQQRYPREGGQPIILGYRASNVIQITIDDLDKVAGAIDAATQSGANQVRNIQFTLRDEQSAKSQALREATRNARADAEAMASALGLKVVRILSVQEGAESPIRPMGGVAMARMEAAPPTPVESGTIEVRATVELVAEVSQ